MTIQHGDNGAHNEERKTFFRKRKYTKLESLEILVDEK